MSDVTIILNTSTALNGLKDAKKRALEICGGKCETYAKQLCPVDTGRLRNSITHQQYDESTEIIGTNVEYAPYVELGTKRQKAQPYLRPAAENHADEYKAIWNNELSKIR